jgi:hypothetical protein
MEEAM